MCGIVAAVSARNIVSVLVEGLRRLEYRGYDSCGVAVHQGGGLRRARSTARVAELAANVAADGLEAAQTLDEHRNEVAGTDAGDDSAHGRIPKLSGDCAPRRTKFDCKSTAVTHDFTDLPCFRYIQSYFDQLSLIHI